MVVGQKKMQPVGLTHAGMCSEFQGSTLFVRVFLFKSALRGLQHSRSDKN